MRRLQCATLLLSLWLALPQASAAAPIARASADVRIQGPIVERSFTGFSQEYHIVPKEVGPIDGPINAPVVALHKRLAAAGGGPPILRIGGTTQDSAWWNPNHGPRPPSIAHDLTPEYFQAVSRFLSATGGKVIIGLNLAANEPSYAVDVARAAEAIFQPGQILAYEVGNEPNVYPIRQHHVAGGEQTTRGKDYDHDAYLPELERHLDALLALDRTLPLMAPGYCCEPWLRDFPDLLRRDADKLSLVTFHRYPLESCGHEPGEPGYPTAIQLLQPQTVTGPVRDLIEPVRKARRRGLRTRLTETNSATCGGAARASDRFAAALWATDWLYTLAATGFAGAHFHGGAPLYQTMRSVRLPDRDNVVVKPIFYGMMLFADANPHRARLLPSTYFGKRARKRFNVSVWGAVDKVDDVVRVVVLHKGGPSGGTVEIEVPYASGSGKLERLRAPGLLAATGVTWAGQGFRIPTSDGRMVGRRVSERVRRRAGSVFRFRVPRVSAAMLTVPVRRTRANRVLG